ncbi:MAG: replication-associated recombination protein A [Mycoplasmataceae bacterium]|jgi:putative ATPase|nr:replication-associated recombination protein A [Mycoplasmataceae bacterium]
MKKVPLALSLRPKTIKDIIGQTHLFNENSFIDRMVRAKSAYSIIFYGVPGIGKTSLAVAIVNDINVPYAFYNAATDNKERLVSILEVAKKSDGNYVIILEEIHRLNRDKQDILLPFIEDGTVHIFATTTENPYFTINPAIRSRCQIFELLPLSKKDIFDGLQKRLKNINLNIKLDDELLEKIAQQVNGDLRAAINIIDILNTLYANERIDANIVKDIMQQSYVFAADYGDEYYDIQSAFHKSLRGSDPNAAIYYLARLLQVGDIESICRQLIACAYEDIGLANPALCNRIVTVCDAAKEVGMPECKQIFATAVIEMSLSPKSNSAYKAIINALEDVKSGKTYNIPLHIKDQSYASASKLGHSGYKYPHDYPFGYVKQQYLPNELKNKQYYLSQDNSIELKMNEYLNKIKSQK